MRAITALSLTILAATTAAAAPGDPKVVQGTLVWPSAVGDERFIVLRTNDGTTYYADVESARSFASGPLRAGERLSLAGLEGQQPHELKAIAIAPEGVLGLGRLESMPTLLAQSTTPVAAVPEPAASPEWQRFEGVVESASAKSMVIRTTNGKLLTVDVSELSKAHWLRSGQHVTVYGLTRPDGSVAASGFILLETPSAAKADGA